MSSAEFTRCLALENIEPSGWEMDNWHFGMLAAGICNAVIATIQVPKGRARPKLLKPEDFYPAIASARKRLSPRQEQELKERRAKRRR